MARHILHFDLDAFYCCVEEQYQPELVGVAFAVGGTSDQRGVVASCSYAARMYGVRSAMPMGQAKRLCADLVVVPARHNIYAKHSQKVMAYLGDITPLVEQLSIDEAFLDVTGIKGGGEGVARQIQHEVMEQFHLPCSLGVASNKLVAKIANNIGKGRHRNPQPPRAIEIVPHGDEARYLAPLPIRELWGVGAKTAQHLQQLSIETIGDIAAQKQQFMIHHFGKHGYDMWRHAQGIDNRPVETEHEAKSISKETTFSRDEHNPDELRRVIRLLSEQVGRRVRRDDLRGSTIKLKLRYADFSTITRQITLPHPTHDDVVIIERALALFDGNWKTGEAVRLLGVGISNFEDAPQQLSLFKTDDDKKKKALQNTLDELRERFGDHSVKRAEDMKRRKR